MKTLFVVQRVSKHFKNTITDSISIQQKMYLGSTGKTSDVWVIRKKSTGVRDDKVYFLSASHPAASGPGIIHCRGQSSKRAEFLTATLNPFCRVFGPYDARLGEQVVLHFPKKSSLLSEGADCTGSWQHMLLTDPPCFNINVYFYCGIPNKHGVIVAGNRVAFDVTDASGLTLGAVLRYALNAENSPAWYYPLHFGDAGTTARPADVESSSVRQTLAEALHEQEAANGLKTEIEYGKILIKLRGVVCPTDNEKASVRTSDKSQK